ncbi:UbiA family prenyltransferase [Rhizobium sp. XQZ8]|uniref:UbiA family prenyltransferase n=1 Tax=Rhizobium populisoli TaxID=2859785 RepID=UPI001CA5EC71|nr:UbiA family prenyltransferase [Rhizobium populisoli]MBW6422596.1 UbiA family prenyltransferase [Rhizobium populisoli]
MTAPARHPQADAPLAQRLWLYQAERFPLLKTSILLAVFSSASISVSAQLAARPLPPFVTFAFIWLVTVIIFFQMRACDEWKDFEDDRRFRPERPIPSGLVSLRLVLGLAGVGGLIALGLTASVSTALILPLAFVWAWLALMTFEFFAPDWLKARPFLYLVSHMAIMPLIDLFVTAAEWLPAGFSPPQGLWLFLLLSFTNGCVLEIGRKVWAPGSEREGVETYSALLGPRRAAWVWLTLCGFAWLLLAGVGHFVGALFIVAGPGLLALAAIGWVARSFIAEPTPARQKKVDTTAGLWVFVCYCLAGFAPLLKHWMAA